MSSYSVANAYDHVEQLDKFTQDANDLREALVHAVRETHPEHREEIEDSIETCRNFLCNFSQIFTLNYDLLLYWIQIGSKSFSDGFGLGKKQGGFIGPFKEAGYCNTFNLHGGLHLFKTATGDVEKIIKGSSGVIDAVSEEITRNKRLPVYVAEGTSEKKLAKINSVHYLRHCLQKLGEVKKNLFVFGHSADQNDAHIYRKIFNSDIEQVYFCIHQPTADQAVIEGELLRYKANARSSCEITFVDSESAKAWG